MSVDVVDMERGQLLREGGTHDGVSESAEAPVGGGAALPEQGAQQLPEDATIGGELAHCAHHFVVGERLKEACLFPEGAFGRGEIVGRNAFAAAADDLRSAAAEFRDFIDHVRFERRRELIGDVGDGGHATDSWGAQSIPATVNMSPMTNWYAMSTKKALKR